MTQEHPITPPPELLKRWREEAPRLRDCGVTREEWIATQASRWGADMELEACCEYLAQCAAWEPEDVQEMRNARRPEPKSLKEQALQVLANADGADHPVVTTVLTADQHALIRRALEALND